MASDTKKKLVQGLAKEIKESPIVALLNLENLPAQQLQVMRRTLTKRKVKLFMTRKKLFKRALEASGKPNIEQLTAKIKGMPALLFTGENPFALYALIQKNKSKAPAKPGQIAPNDIMVKAGPTQFAPGPIISELAAVGIKTKVEGGKLAVISDTVIVKEGQPISQKVSETMKRLDIKPMEIGLNLVAVWENGLVFDAKNLHIDEAEYAGKIGQAASWALNLAIEAAYPCAESTELLLQKAFRDSKAVAVDAAYVTEETQNELLAKSEQQALSVKQEAQL